MADEKRDGERRQESWVGALLTCAHFQADPEHPGVCIQCGNPETCEYRQPQRCTSCKGYGERNYGGTPYGMEECLRCDGTGLEPQPPIVPLMSSEES